MTRDAYRRVMMTLGAIGLASAVGCAHSGGTFSADAAASSMMTESVTWYDGGTERTAWLRPDLVAEFHTAGGGTRTLGSQASLDELVHESGGASIWKSAGGNAIAVAAASSGARLSEVFQDLPSGGRLRALPGNVIVTLDPGLTSEEVEQWAAANGQRIVDRMRYGRNVVVLESAPGMASLELANRLRQRKEVLAAEPNWWQETATR